jgi:hypothetical protein
VSEPVSGIIRDYQGILQNAVTLSKINRLAFVNLAEQGISARQTHILMLAFSNSHALAHDSKSNPRRIAGLTERR